jgi:polar amino acid transport system substrate-binding protein
MRPVFTMRIIRTSAVAVILAAVWSIQAHAAPVPSAKELRVAVKQAEPFVFLDRTPPTGYSLELWQEVARMAGLAYTLVPASSVAGMIDALSSGGADVAVGALSITAERETQMDFSHGIYDSGLGLMVRSDAGGARWFLNLLQRSKIPLLVGILLLAIFVNGNIIWFLQRHHDNPHFPRNYFKGVGEAMWWSISVFLNGCCENKEVSGVSARLLAVIWFFTGVTSISFVTATLASSMTLSELTSRIHDLADLKGGEIATVGKSRSEEFLDSRNLRPLAEPDIASAIRDLAEGRVRAVFYDMPILRYQASHHPGEKMMVLPVTYLPHQYGFGMQVRSPYRKQINQALLNLKENGRMEELRRKWFGDDDSLK